LKIYLAGGSYDQESERKIFKEYGNRLLSFYYKDEVLKILKIREELENENENKDK